MNRMLKSGLFRAGQMLLGWAFVGIVYHLSDRLQGGGRLITPSWVDNLIPFSASAIWLYLSFFLIIPLGYFLAPLTAVRWLARAMQISALGAGAIYLGWPTTLQYPVDVGMGMSAQFLSVLTVVDSAQNCLPSLHITLTILAVWAISKGKRPLRTSVFILWGVAIAFSILQLKRHLFVDLVGGIVLALVAGMLAQWMTRCRNRQKEQCNE